MYTATACWFYLVAPVREQQRLDDARNPATPRVELDFRGMRDHYQKLVDEQDALLNPMTQGFESLYVHVYGEQRVKKRKWCPTPEEAESAKRLRESMMTSIAQNNAERAHMRM